MFWRKILIGSSAAALLGCGSAVLALAASSDVFVNNTKSAVVMIASFDPDGDFMGWGSGFFVDENIVVTNRHVLDDGTFYRVFAAGSGGVIDLDCFRTLSRSDIKINLDDDVAYVRASLDCSHGRMYFANSDPTFGDSIGILGYPSKGSFSASLTQSRVTGTVTKTDDGPWFRTNAFVDFGNSGGPVVKDDRIVGVVVAKAIDEQKKFLYGLFVPVSQIIKGLENANNSTFGYTPQALQNNPSYQLPTLSGPATDADCAAILGQGSQAADDGGCRCRSGYQRDFTGAMCVRSSSSSSSSSVSSTSSISSSSSSSSRSSSRQRSDEPAVSTLQARTCKRVLRLFGGNANILARTNVRLEKRFGFTCHP